MIELVCKQCGKKFYVKPYLKNTAKFCCKDCSNKSFIGKKRKPFTKETIDKMKLAQSIANSKPEVRKNKGDARRGEKHWRWMGGIESENKRIRKSISYKLWREGVFERDNYTCQKCGSRSMKGKRLLLHPHHIMGFSQYPEYRFIKDNGATLCDDCHNEFHYLYGYIDIEKHWKNWLNNKK